MIVKLAALTLVILLVASACTRPPPAPFAAPTHPAAHSNAKNAEVDAKALVRLICGNDFMESKSEIGCTSCGPGKADQEWREPGALQRTLDRAISGHFTAPDANEQLVFMSGCGMIGTAEAYVVSSASGRREVLSRSVNSRPDDVKTFRRRDSRTGIVILSISGKQGWEHRIVRICSAGAKSALECEDLFVGVSARDHCPPEQEQRTDIDDVSVALADHDGDGNSDILLHIKYSVWPSLTDPEAYKLALSTGCAVKVPSPPAPRVPEPTTGTTTLVYVNRSDRFEETAETIARVRALGAYARRE